MLLPISNVPENGPAAFENPAGPDLDRSAGDAENRQVQDGNDGGSLPAA